MDGLMIVFQTLVDGAFLGIIIGISIAFPILVIATQNIIVGTFAAINILAITVCVLGVIPLAGWKLDVSKYFINSLNMNPIVSSLKVYQTFKFGFISL